MFPRYFWLISCGVKEETCQSTQGEVRHVGAIFSSHYVGSRDQTQPAKFGRRHFSHWDISLAPRGLLFTINGFGRQIIVAKQFLIYLPLLLCCLFLSYCQLYYIILGTMHTWDFSTLILNVLFKLFITINKSMVIIIQWRLWSEIFKIH